MPGPHAQFATHYPYPLVELSLLGDVLWANLEAAPLLEDWRIEVGGRVPGQLGHELRAFLANDREHALLLGLEGDPAFEIMRFPTGEVFLAGRGMTDPIADQIRSARRTKSAFLANMSHELRTPLNAILGYTELLVEEAEEEGDDHIVPDLNRVNKAASHLLRLINDILDVSKIEAGRVGLFLENFSVLELIQDVVDTVRPLLEANGNTLRLEVSVDQPVMRADRTKLRQLLFNLLDNACKFTESGEILVRVSTREIHGEPRHIFEVTDTGIGMSEDKLAHLFRPFTQADVSTTRRYGGTGLGLALCQLLSHLMGGEVQVRSVLGQGSTFEVHLPTVVDPSGVHIQAPTGRVQYHGKGDGTVLVIDDDPVVRDLLTRFLVKEGYRVICAPDGETGLQVARTEQPDAITLDVMMPRVDGWEVLRRLKAEEATRAIPVVMVSIVDNTGLGFALGASDYLTKPIHRGSLLQALAPFRGSSSPGHVLVVDDNADVRDLTARTLRRAGWEVDEAVNGRTALEYLERHRPSVVLLDLLMPGVDGFEVVDRMRSHPQWRSIPVLVVTAKDLTPEDRERLQGGVESVVNKSGRTLEHILAEMKALLG